MAPMDAALHPAAARRLAQAARQQFVEGMGAGLPALVQALESFLSDLMNQTATQREMQLRRDAWMAFQAHKRVWSERAARAWSEALAPSAAPESRRSALPEGLSLLDDDVVENRISASRMALLVLEQTSTSFDAVRQRTQKLEGAELPASDILRPEGWCLGLVEAWQQAGLKRDDFALIADPLQRELGGLALTQYQELVKFYDARGVSAPSAEDLRARVRRPAAGAGGPGGGTGGATFGGAPGVGPHSGPASLSGPLAPVSRPMGMGMHPTMGAAGYPPHPGAAHHALVSGHPMAGRPAGLRAPAGGWATAPAGLAHAQPQPYAFAPTQFVGPGSRAAAFLGGGAYLPTGGSLTGPLMRARQRAQNVMAQLRRLMTQPAVGHDGSHAAPATAALTQALAMQRAQTESQYRGLVVLAREAPPLALAQAASVARERTEELKKKATTPSEKAVIEVVALMFQAILSEERIPPAVRVWFARLQVPVLRVALAEPEFFSTLTHPARQLIDRMGACVLGFNSSSIDGSALEAEIRRIVQMIEQYPETGQRVFAIAHEEFEAFLARFLTGRQTTTTARLASVAQQVEQRETLAIQYTIELRSLLAGMPVRDEIREFLFKTWTEVLAVSAVRHGAQHAVTAECKRAAADLVWAASAKPGRADRAQVIQNLPALLQSLRRGLALLGVNGPEQDAQIKVLTDTLADAFLSKTAPIPQEQIDAMARRLANLEEYLSDEALGDMPLSAENIELLLGIDASSIQVIADNGAPVEPDMIAWAQHLAPGAWFTLKHGGSSAQVQYVWHSQRRQLHLFVASGGVSYLLQLRRLAAYLQARLLTPQEEESLTLRATREALTQLDAHPERLLG